MHFVISGDGVVSAHDGPCPALDELREEFDDGEAGAEQFVRLSHPRRA